MNYVIFIQEILKKYAWVKEKSLLLQYIREELQYLLLRVIFTKQTYPVIFMGGTQLRLSYTINRFSEDIDLALEKPDRQFPSEKFFSSILAAFLQNRSGFRIHLRSSFKRNVVKGIISFSQVLFDLGISPLKDETLKIKIEIDTNPPEHAHGETKTYQSFFGDFTLRVFDLSTGFAGKCAAILQREYQKGRDYYDLQWYLRRRPAVDLNISYLNSNLVQQNGKPFKQRQDIIKAILQKVSQVEQEYLRKDLERFIIMDPESFDIWIQQYISETESLLKAYITTL